MELKGTRMLSAHIKRGQRLYERCPLSAKAVKLDYAARLNTVAQRTSLKREEGWLMSGRISARKQATPR